MPLTQSHPTVTAADQPSTCFCPQRASLVMFRFVPQHPGSWGIIFTQCFQVLYFCCHLLHCLKIKQQHFTCLHLSALETAHRLISHCLTSRNLGKPLKLTPSLDGTCQ